MSQKILLILLVGLFFITSCLKNTNQNSNNNSTNTNQTVNSVATTDTNKSNLNEVPTKKDFSIEFKTASTETTANKETELNFVIKDKTGTQIKDFKVVHEKKMHLIAVSEDLSQFEHLHPELQPDGSFNLKHTFKNGGKFLLYPDVTPENGTQIVERIPLEIKGNSSPFEKLIVDTNLTKQMDGISVTMKPDGELSSNKEMSINFVVTDDSSGKPVSDLQTYLGELAHIVVISEDTQDFLHVHPMSNKKSDETSVMAHTNFPRGGIYKLWIQFQRNNKIITIPYVINVTKGTEKAENPSKSDNGIVKIKVNGEGFKPENISVTKGEKIKLIFLREDEKNCGDEIVFSKFNIKEKLPVGKEVAIEINPTETGEIAFSCGMNMMKGKIIVE